MYIFTSFNGYVWAYVYMYVYCVYIHVFMNNHGVEVMHVRM